MSTLLLSCESSSDISGTIDFIVEEKIPSKKATKNLQKAIEQQALAGSLFESYFDEGERAAFLAIKKLQVE